MFASVDAAPPLEVPLYNPRDPVGGASDDDVKVHIDVLDEEPALGGLRSGSCRLKVGEAWRTP